MPYATKPTPKTTKLTDLAPPRWFSSKVGSSIFVSAYRAVMVDQLQFSTVKSFEVLDVLVFPVAGTLNYNSVLTSPSTVKPDGSVDFKVHNLGTTTTPQGNYFVLLTPFDIAGTPGVEHTTRERVKSARGFLIASFGRNAALDSVYEMICAMDGDRTTSFTHAIENSSFHGPPVMTAQRRRIVGNVQQRANQLAPEVRVRMGLALRWFEDATMSRGLDGFLKLWFAIETLAMPNTSDVRPANYTLAAAYGIELQKAQEKFKLGRLCGLRSKIVHEGKVATISATLDLYTEAIFIDLLLEILGEPCERRAQSVMERPDFDLMSLLGQS